MILDLGRQISVLLIVMAWLVSTVMYTVPMILIIAALILPLHR